MGKQQKETQIEVSGNKGGNYVHITKLDDNRLYIRVGDCCVHTAEIIVTAEVLSNFLTMCSLNANKPLLSVMRESMSWEESVNEEFFNGCKSFK